MEKYITEHEYRRVETARKEALASLIRRSGLSYSSIADATGVERRAAKRAAVCEGRRYDTAVRLEYFLRRIQTEHGKDKI